MSALTWRTLAERLAHRAADLRAWAGRLRTGWSGTAADAALARLTAVATGYDDAAAACLAVDQALAEPTAPDAATADRLGLARLAFASGATRQPAAWPPPGADPATVRRWWDGLPAGVRDTLFGADPARLGALDGVPAAVRDQANRIALAATGDPALTALLARLDTDRPRRAYLLSVDPSGDGRAVVAVGDPDRAANVLTYVPGTGATLAGIGKGVLMPAADLLAAAAGADTSVVLWLGYDAPDNPVVAGYPGYARRAEVALSRFESGLAASRDGPPPHRTVLGHSYGSTVVGYAARDRRLAADDLVFLGSPGVGGEHAAELGVPPGHVWSGTAAADPIRLTVAGRSLADSVADALLPAHRNDLWFGADPSSPDFGARVVATAPGSPLHPVRTHDGYFEPANPAFGAVVRIAAAGPAAPAHQEAAVAAPPAHQAPAAIRP